ncbi:rfaE bifunctional protein, domain II [Amycolatopsis arida]|uniref:D-glycero-beta-D-manno-heptose 1-phosphate adenylyltransferase n=1 Tax=Amycolatopsis arida TaxID=587909 RepID=A0A1I5XGK2_9PSEU|nr:D-glycero-beta-D-manno-heptose 1-phosphate adenylyltransferase [Amycolatopsis arida]TDX97466.1 rfaE bifunctional protein nucleotidyltransferase chain/domain [Amycolatopsis arida]SFQ31093.1 rfaE bifunctional protein, domain II [Amycolatopsis arida]
MRPLVVVGDALLDIDIEGSADRLCPEAPVPVVDIGREWLRPGGAGLATLLAARSTSEVVLVSAFADDGPGRTLRDLLRREAEVVPLPLAGGTVCKTRVRAGGQSLLRLDSGDGRAAGDPLPRRAERVLRGAGAILVADYGRGLAAHRGLRRLLAELARTVPVVWDPHPRGPAPVPGVRLATPNEAEAAGFAGDSPGDAAALAERLREAWECTGTAVTVGARGAVLAGDGPTRTVPVPGTATVTGPSRPDTCGAGDRFASAAAAALLGGAGLADAVAEAVDAAARFVAAGGAAALSVCDAPGTAPARPDGPAPAGTDAFELAARVRRSGGRLVATGGCFDLLHPGHVSLLRQARALGDALVVCLNSDASVRRLKGPTRPIVSAPDRARLLAELESVDAVVVFDEPSPKAVLDRLRPDVWVKGGDYAGTELPEARVVRRHGGEVVLVPLTDGYSTTRLVAAASNGRH